MPPNQTRCSRSSLCACSPHRPGLYYLVWYEAFLLRSEMRFTKTRNGGAKRRADAVRINLALRMGWPDETRGGENSPDIVPATSQKFPRRLTSFYKNKINCLQVNFWGPKRGPSPAPYRVAAPTGGAVRFAAMKAVLIPKAVASRRQSGKSGDVRVFEQARSPTTERGVIGKTNAISPTENAGSWPARWCWCRPC